MLCFLFLAVIFMEEPVGKLFSDELNNLYVTTSDKIYKYDDELNLVATYSSKFGKITDLLLLNPFKVVIFCQDYYRIILLDNQLTQTQTPIFLPDYNILQPKAVAAASDGGIWIYDSYKQQICYIDFASRQQRNTFSIADLLESGNIVSFYEYKQQLYFAVENQGVFVFSKFGNLISRYDLPNLTSFKVEHGLFYYCDKEKCYTFSSWQEIPTTISYHTIGEFTSTPATQFYYENKTLKVQKYSEE